MLHWSLCIQPRFVATLCYEGFLPMCTEVRQAKSTTLRRAAAHACRGQPRLHYEQSAVAEMRTAAWLPLALRRAAPAGARGSAAGPHLMESLPSTLG